MNRWKQQTLMISRLGKAYLSTIRLVSEFNFNELLHELRTDMLREHSLDGKTMLSAGASGAPFFDWIKGACGSPRRHIAIEKYLAKPEILPPEVEWIANTCSDMSAVSSDSVDIVFSGQNIEHLWPEEIIGFFLEANRVLRNGGMLWIDSPNRFITEQVGWCHPEHLIEFTVDEVLEVITAAGFVPERVKGIWLCRDRKTGMMLPYDKPVVFGWTMTKRALQGRDRPNDSFIWWVEARKTGQPNSEAVKRRVSRTVAIAWPSRLSRMISSVGRELKSQDGSIWIDACRQETGWALYGPYIPLRAGEYAVTFEVKITEKPEKTFDPVATFDIVSNQGTRRIAEFRFLSETSATDPAEIRLPFNLEETTFGVEFRCFVTGSAGLRLRKGVRLQGDMAP